MVVCSILKNMANSRDHKGSSLTNYLDLDFTFD